MTEVEVAAFGALRLSCSSGRGGHFQRMPGGGHRPPPITKDLVQGWVKEMVAEQKPTPVESRSNTGCCWGDVGQEKYRIVLGIMSVVDALRLDTGQCSVQA